MPFGRSLIALFAFALAVSAVELTTLDGKKISGSLTSVTDTAVTLKTDDGPIVTPLSKVLLLTIRDVKSLESDVKFSEVHLLDDTVLHCKNVQFQSKNAVMTLLSGTELKVPLTYVVTFVREAQDRPLARKFAEIAHKRLKRDRIVILRDGELNTLEGTLGEVDEKAQTISFNSEVGGVRELPFAKLHGIIFFRGEVVSESPICKVFDTDGNSLTALKLAHDGTNLALTTTLGTKLSLPAEAVAKVDFNMGKLTYLSDMTPLKVVEKSGIGDIHPYCRDKNLDGQPIVLDGKEFGKGLSLHAYTELEYNLAGKYNTFKATLGIDVRTGADSEPRVTIYCDGVEQFNQLVTIKSAVPVALNVKDVNTLRIVVSARDFTDLRDHCSLAEARVSQ